MSYLPEIARIYPTLSGHSVLIIESPQTAGELYADLHALQSMKVAFIDAASFPSNLADCVKNGAFESSIIHIPGVATTKKADAYIRNVLEAYTLQSRMIILEGAPADRVTIKLYEDLRTVGIAMLNKSPYLEVVKKLAKLFD